jgi:hypothetical protein
LTLLTLGSNQSAHKEADAITHEETNICKKCYLIF